MWMCVMVWKAPPLLLRVTATCQLIPLLPNQSVCPSRNFLGKNFMAQSHVIMTSLSVISSRSLVLASSWFLDLIRWLFISFMLSMACWTLENSKKNSINQINDQLLVTALVKISIDITGMYWCSNYDFVLSKWFLYRYLLCCFNLI